MTVDKGQIRRDAGRSRENPLTLRDLPFTVPSKGRYWLDYGQGPRLMPESPKGAVIALEIKP